MNLWLSWNLAHFGPAIGGVVFERVAPMFFKGYEVDQVHLDKSLVNLEKYASILNQHLADKVFVGGEKPSLADIALAVPLVHKDMAQLPLEAFSHLLSWYERVSAFPYFQKTLPQAVPAG